MVIDSAKLFTFHQRANELMRALKRHWTQERQDELKDIEEQLKDIGQSIGKLHRKPKS
jgi:hypothetical protein